MDQIEENLVFVVTDYKDAFRQCRVYRLKHGVPPCNPKLVFVDSAEYKDTLFIPASFDKKAV